MTGAIFQATVVISTAPEMRTGRRAGDAPGSQSEFAFVRAKGDDGTRWELYGLTPTTMAAIGKLGLSDTVTIAGALAVKCETGAAIVQISVTYVALRLPITPRPKAKPKAPKPRSCGRGTRQATAAGVQAANARWYAKNGGQQS